MVLNFHHLFGRYVHHISAGNNFSVTLRHNGLHQNWGRKYFFQNGVKRICFYLSPTFISNSSMFIHATCCPPLHQGQLRSMVGFPSTWLEINPSRLDFQPLVRNPTAGWYSTHWMVRIPTILPLCIKYRNLSQAPQIVETFC